MGKQSNLFSAFSPLNGGSLDTYGYPVEHPYDLDASLDYTRFTGTFSYFPFPLAIGHVTGLVPMLDGLQSMLAQTKSPNGPFIGATSAPINVIFPNQLGGLAKIKG